MSCAVTSGGWKPGQSGNAHGMNRKYRQLIAHCRVQSRAMADRLIECANDHDAPWSARIAAATAILDRAWGKPKETVEIAGDSGVPMLTIRIVDPNGSESGETITINAAPEAAQPALEASTAPASDSFTLSFGRGK